MEHCITINGLDAHVNVEHGIETASAYGVTFDEDARIVTETEPARWSGYCDACIVYDVASAMLATRRRIEHEDIDAAVERAGLSCTCAY